MATLESYLSALRKAQAKNDVEAVAYFEGKIREMQNQAKPDTQGVVSRMSDELGVPESITASLIGSGRGFEDVYRGAKRIIGMDLDPRDEKSWQALEEEYPIAAGVGQAVGQAGPFAVAGPAVAAGRVGVGMALGRTVAPLSTGARIAGGAGLGAAEGGAIVAGTNNESNALEILGGAAIGGTVGGLAETIAPVIGRVYNKLRSKPIVDADGNMTDAGRKAFQEAGLDDSQIDEAVLPALQKIKINPNDELIGEDLQRLMDFESAGIPYTRGDIMSTGTAEGFEQKVFENRLLESSTDELAQPVRDIKRVQSAAIQDKLRELSADPITAGSQVKEALSGRKRSLKNLSGRYYRALAREAESIDEIPLDVSAGIDDDLLEDIAINESTAIPALRKRMLAFGIGEPEQIESFVEAGGKVEPLTLRNFERFRKTLNNAAQGNPRMQAAVSPIIRELDEQIELAISGIESAGGSKLLDAAKKARATVRQEKTEFDPKSIVGRLVSAKAGDGSQVIEASDAVRQIMPTGTRPKTEDLGRIVKSLSQSGVKGKKALESLQGAVVMRMMDRAFKQESNRVGDQVLFSGNQFSKAFDEFGDDNLELLFAGNKAAINELRKIKKVAENVKIDSKTVPKGSASFLGDKFNQLAGTLASAKLGAPVAVLMEGAQALSKKAEMRKKAQSIGKTGPKFTPKEKTIAKQIQASAPNLAVAIGVPLILEDMEGENE